VCVAPCVLSLKGPNPLFCHKLKSRTFAAPEWEELAGGISIGGWSPLGAFTEVRILKDLKSFVSEVRELKELQVLFAEVRIGKGLGFARRRGLAPGVDHISDDSSAAEYCQIEY
jgi:hypothetical protein